MQRVQSVNTAPKLQKRLEVTMRNIKRRKIEGYETVLFELTDRSYNDLGAFIPDGYSKEVAVRQAKRWMAENSIVLATLIVNSLRTSNVLDVIDIDILKTKI